jgi:hypothetical protein
MTQHSPDRSFDDGHENKYGYHIPLGRQQDMLRSISAANFTKTTVDNRSRDAFMKKSGSTD